MKLYSIDLADNYLVAVEDWHDPVDTLLRCCPDFLRVAKHGDMWSERWAS